MERPKLLVAGVAGLLDKRKKMEDSKESRIDAKQVIDDLIKSANLEHDVNAEGNTRSSYWRWIETNWEMSFLQRPGCSWKTSRRMHNHIGRRVFAAKSMETFGEEEKFAGCLSHVLHPLHHLVNQSINQSVAREWRETAQKIIRLFLFFFLTKWK